MTQPRTMNNPYGIKPIPGFRFSPTEEELVGHYLHNKYHQTNINHLDLIKQCDLYGKEEPWQIWDSFGGAHLDKDSVKDLYLFTFLKGKTLNGSRVDRTVGSGKGTWHGENKPKQLKLKFEGNWFKATKKMFTYKNSDSDQDGLWIMYEYSLSCESQPNELVLCQLRRNESYAALRRTGKRKRGSLEIEEDVTKSDSDATVADKAEIGNEDQDMTFVESLRDVAQVDRLPNMVPREIGSQEIEDPTKYLHLESDKREPSASEPVAEHQNEEMFFECLLKPCENGSTFSYFDFVEWLSKVKPPNESELDVLVPNDHIGAMKSLADCMKD